MIRVGQESARSFRGHVGKEAHKALSCEDLHAEAEDGFTRRPDALAVQGVQKLEGGGGEDQEEK